MIYKILVGSADRQLADDLVLALSTATGSIAFDAEAAYTLSACRQALKEGTFYAVITDFIALRTLDLPVLPLSIDYLDHIADVKRNLYETILRSAQRKEEQLYNSIEHAITDGLRKANKLQPPGDRHGT